MDYITTKSGKKFYVDLVATIQEPSFAYIRILNSDIVTIACVFSDEDEISAITYNDTVLPKYTKLGYIIGEPPAYKIRLEA